jgi:NADH-quinone oxidoreductase subunit L
MAKGLVSVIACGSVALSFVIALICSYDIFHAHGAHRIIQPLFTWVALPDFTLELALLLDALSSVMVLLVTGVGFLIHLYSIGYMHDDISYSRYFAYLNLFIFCMLILVLGDSLPLAFVGWEGVGLCSYLLIGFWFDDQAKASAGKKAFIVNRIGDFGFLLGMFTLFAVCGALSFDGIRMAVGSGMISPLMATVACLLLFWGATGKSAQIPLYVWLPDAMAGPTPVSALIHAATMVTAGIYMIARLSFLYALAPTASAVVVLVGAATAIFAATIGLCQTDIKKVLAYSTVSQLGYMFVAVGVGAYFAGVFHLMTHAFFKACLFLGSGAVIHALEGEQDMRHMGGLRHKLPYTYYTFLIATLAISGIPPLAGFFSKDEILWQALSSDSLAPWAQGWVHPLAYALGLAAAALTAFYMFRLLILTFYGSSRIKPQVRVHHESPLMSGPLVVLALFSAVGGWVGASLLGIHAFKHYLDPVLGLAGEMAVRRTPLANSHLVEWGAAALSVTVALLALMAAFYIYLKTEGAVAERLAQRVRGLYRLILSKYWIDEIYEAVFVKPLHFFAVFLRKVIDEVVIDGTLVNGAARMLVLAGTAFKRTESGNVQTYAFAMFAGLVALVLYFVLNVGM